MPGSSLEGLNVVHLADDHGAALDLSDAAPIPDLEAQLAFWTNLAFQSDEPFVPRPLSPASGEHHKPAAAHPPPRNGFDVNHFFAGFDIDPFLSHPIPNNGTPSLIDPAGDLTALLPPLPESHSAPPPETDTISSQDTKRQKLPKPADEVSSADAEPTSPDADSASPDSSYLKTSTPHNAAEDKRRRNTAASARFRAKKKEREAALEKRSKELESRVGELERECEALRRENGWLKGLVVGVTGAGATPSGTQSGKRRRQDEGQETSR